MTDNEIIQALECCGTDMNCHCCPAKEDENGCIRKTCQNALDLINRQRVEIERLKKGYFWVEESVTKTAKSEAIKEFAEKFEAILVRYECDFIENQDWSARNTILQILVELNNLLKEREDK